MAEPLQGEQPGAGDLAGQGFGVLGGIEGLKPEYLAGSPFEEATHVWRRARRTGRC